MRKIKTRKMQRYSAYYNKSILPTLEDWFGFVADNFLNEVRQLTFELDSKSRFTSEWFSLEEENLYNF